MFDVFIFVISLKCATVHVPGLETYGLSLRLSIRQSTEPSLDCAFEVLRGFSAPPSIRSATIRLLQATPAGGLLVGLLPRSSPDHISCPTILGS